MITAVDMKSRSVMSKSEVPNVCHVKSVFYCDPKGVYFYRDLLVGHNDREKAKHANTEEMHCSNRVLHCHIYEKRNEVFFSGLLSHVECHDSQYVM